MPTIISPVIIAENILPDTVLPTYVLQINNLTKDTYEWYNGSINRYYYLYSLLI